MIPPGIDLRRDAVASFRPPAPGDRARTLVAATQGDGSRAPRVRGPRRRAPHRRGRPPPGGARALPRRRHRRRPAERRLVRAVRDRVHGARQAGRHVPPRRSDAPHRRGVRAAGAARQRVIRVTPRSARGARGDGACGTGRDRHAPRARTSSVSTTSSTSPTASSSSTTPSSHRRGSRARAMVVPSEPAADIPPALPLGQSELEAVDISDPEAVEAPRIPAATGGLGTAPPPRPPLRHLRDRRPRLAHHRRPPVAALHAVPHAGRLRQDRDTPGADDRDGADPPGGDHECVLPLLLRRRRQRGTAAGHPDVVLVHDGRRRRSASCCCSRSPTRSRRCCSAPSGAANLVRASGVALWATVNYEQLTALFRVEERSRRVRVRRASPTSSSRSASRSFSSSCSRRGRSASSSGTSAAR